MILHHERLRDVHPELVAIIEEMAYVFGAEFDLAVVEGFRTQRQQLELYAKGRTMPGNIVTHAKNAEETPHGRGAAVDVCPVELKTGKYLWDDKEKFETLGKWGKAAGLGWGGDFKHLADLDHFELTGWKELPFDDDRTPTDLPIRPSFFNLPPKGNAS